MGFRKITPWKKQGKSEPVLFDVKEPQPEITTKDTDTEIPFLTGNDRKYESQSPIKTRRPEPSVIPFSKPNKSPQRSKIHAVSKPIGRTIEAYTNRSNELLIQNPMDTSRFTVYPDIGSYNRRSVIPESRYKNTIDMSTLKPVTIDPDNNMRNGKM